MSLIILATYVKKGSDGRSHASPSVPIFAESLKTMRNVREIRDADYLNGVVVNQDENRVVQATGYSPERGLFCDMY